MSTRIALPNDIIATMEKVARGMGLPDMNKTAMANAVIKYALEIIIQQQNKEQQVRPTNQLSRLTRDKDDHIIFCELQQIKNIFKFLRCPCNASLNIVQESNRDCKYRIKAQCTMNHTFFWANSSLANDSQHMTLSKLIPAALLLSEGTYTKIESFCRILKIKIMSNMCFAVVDAFEQLLNATFHIESLLAIQITDY